MFDQCLQLNPALAANVYRMKARVSVEKGELEEAVALYRRALKLDPKLPDAWYHLGRALLDLGRADEVIETMQDAIRVRGQSADHYYLLGQGTAGEGV